MLHIIFLALCALPLRAEIFIISELFGDKDPRQSWLELTLLEGKMLHVQDIKIILEYRTKKDQKIMLERHLPKPIDFSEKIILAAHQNLGQNQCLISSIQRIVLPELIIKNGLKKICIMLNEHESCSQLDTKDRFSMQTALYRRENDRAKKPHWFKEPCFIGQIFASPGLSARFCEHSLPVIFENCEAPFFMKRFEATELKPASADAFRITNDSIDFEATNTEFAQAMRLCLAPKNSSKICHELGRFSLSRKASIKLPSLSGLMRTYKVFIEIDELLKAPSKHHLVER